MLLTSSTAHGGSCARAATADAPNRCFVLPAASAQCAGAAARLVLHPGHALAQNLPVIHLLLHHLCRLGPVQMLLLLSGLPGGWRLASRRHLLEKRGILSCSWEHQLAEKCSHKRRALCQLPEQRSQLRWQANASNPTRPSTHFAPKACCTQAPQCAYFRLTASQQHASRGRRSFLGDGGPGRRCHGRHAGCNSCRSHDCWQRPGQHGR